MTWRYFLTVTAAALAVIATGWSVCWLLAGLAHGVLSIVHALIALAGMALTCFLISCLEVSYETADSK